MKQSAGHESSLFFRLSALFEKAEDKMDGMIQSCKIHRLNFNTTNVAAGTLVAFDIDADATHPTYVEFYAYIDTIFNAGTTNVVTLGSDITTAVNIFAGADIAEGTVGSNTPKIIKFTARTKVYMKYTQTGGAATTGQCTFLATVKNCFNW